MGLDYNIEKAKVKSFFSLKTVFLFGLFCLPLIHWPWGDIPYEVPKVWFFQRWVEVLAFSGIWKIYVERFEPEKVKDKSRLILGVVSFLAIALVASLFGANVFKSVFGNYYRIDGLITLLHLAGLFFFLNLFWEKSWEKLVIRTIALGSIVVSFWRLFYGLADGFFPPFGQPNFLAGYLLITLPFTALLLQEKGRLRKLGFIGLAGQVGAILLTGSRAGALGILVLGGWSLWGRVKTIGKIAILGVLGTGLFLAGLFWFPEKKVINNNTFFPESRTRIIVKGLLAFSQRPIFGWGWANFDAAFATFDWPIKLNNDIYVDKAHGNFLEVLVATGIVGFLVYLFLIYQLFRTLLTKRDQSSWAKVILTSFLLYLFHSQTNIISINEELIFWLILGINSRS
jgi:O-antigen ligase